MKFPDSPLVIALLISALPLKARAESAQVRPEIVSAWSSSDGKSLLIFYYNGTYQQAIDSPTSPGMERGKFQWLDDGTFTAQTLVDTNGTFGLSHPTGAMTLGISANTLTLATAGSPSQTYSRVTSASSPLVGCWYSPGDESCFAFLANNTYFSIEEEDGSDEFDGMERGTYSWNSTTHVISATPSVDTNGDTGLSTLPPGFQISVSGNVLTATDGDETDTFERLVTSAAPLPLPEFGATKIAYYRQSSDDAPAAGDDPYGADAYIDPTVGAVAAKFKIGSRAAIDFETDDEGYFDLEYDYPSKAVMDQAANFPDNTNLQFLSTGAGSAIVKFPAAGTYPSVPKLVAEIPEDEDQGGHWADGAYQFGEDEVLRWSLPVGFNAASQLVVIEVEDQEAEEKIFSQVIQGETTALDLKGLLAPGRRYNVNIEFVKIAGIATSATAPFAGKTGYAVYSSKLELDLVSHDFQPSLPVFGLQPASGSAELGSQITLTSAAYAYPVPAYQWYKNGAPLPGQTGRSLTLLHVTADDFASYTVKATNTLGNATSNVANLLPPDPFDTFVGGFGLNPSTTGAFDADNDKDGLVNLLEFVLGGNPLVPDRNLSPTFTTVANGGGRNLIVQYPRKVVAAGLNPIIETSPNLQPPWTPAVKNSGGVIITTTSTDATTDLITVTIPTNGSRNFARLRVGPSIVINLENSYHNFKEIGLQPQNLPPIALGGTNARGYGNFFGDGSIGLFTATLTYNPQSSFAAATNANFAFWRRQPNGSFIKDTALFSGSSGCIHPRKALVADFNGDGKPDVFVVCHGYDNNPFPGEKNRVVLSQSNGTYMVREAAPDVGFFHGAAAADVDKDGDIDVITVRDLAVFLNDGTGTFHKELRNRLPLDMAERNYFSVELMDVNGDAVPDLVAGGHEFEEESNAPTRVYINPGNFNFAAVAPVEIPLVPNEGVVLDFTVSGGGPTRALWVLRTSGGDGTFYQGRTLQKVTWPGLQSSLPLHDRSLPWLDWLIATSAGGVPGFASDNANISSFIAQ